MSAVTDRRAPVLLGGALLGVAVLAGCAGQQQAATMRGGEIRADPSKVVAAELAFARTAQEKGQWTAFVQYSSDEAVMFTPAATNAHQWLKGRANPAATVKWQPQQVWASCDGSLAVTKGPWQRPAGVGFFTTVWKRQRDGQYKWVMDQGDSLTQALPEREMIDGKVAECASRPDPYVRGRREAAAPATIRPTVCEGICTGGGTSADGTLTYEYSVAPTGARTFSVQMRQDGAMREVLRSQVGAPE